MEISLSNSVLEILHSNMSNVQVDQVKLIKVLIKSDRQVTERKIGEKLNLPKSTDYNHIQRLGLVKKLDIWALHELKEIHLTNRINAIHLKHNEYDPFLKRIITKDEKRIVYNNASRKLIHA